MKAIFEYDSVTGQITDKNGLNTYMLGMVPFKNEKESSENSISDIIKLKNAGFTADEIMQMKKLGIA